MTKTIKITCEVNDKLPLNALTEFQGKLKKLEKKEYQKLKSSIIKYGFSFPIFVWKNGANNIIDGHQRISVLKDMVLEGYSMDNVPVIYIDAKNEKEAKEKVLLATSSYAKVNNEGLYEFLSIINIPFEEIKDYIDIPSVNLEQFENKYYNKIIEDDPPPLPKNSNSKLGEIYSLGDHRLMCGDATKPEDMEKLMAGKKADMIFTDPPYSVNYGYDQKELQEKSGGKFSKTRLLHTIAGDDLTTEQCAEKIWRPSFRNLYENSKDDCSFYMTMCQGGDQMMMMMMMMMRECWQVKHELIWVKSSPVFSMGRLDYDYQHEPILFGWKKKHNFYGQGEFKKSVWEIQKPAKSDLHPTMKPIALIVNAIMNSSKQGDIILDSFVGSGSAIIACEQTKRICYGMEIDPYYCDVIKKRYGNFIKNSLINSENG